MHDTQYTNKTEDDLNYSTDNSRTEIDYYLNKMSVKKDDEYKDDNSQALNSNKIVINKTEAEEALNDILMSINFSINVVNYVIGTTNSHKKI